MFLSAFKNFLLFPQIKKKYCLQKKLCLKLTSVELFPTVVTLFQDFIMEFTTTLLKRTETNYPSPYGISFVS